MAKFKGSRAALTTKCGRKQVAPPGYNRFSVLELEEPYEHFPLLELPQELRDQVFDEIVRDDKRHGQKTVAKIRVDEDGIEPPTTVFKAFDISTVRGSYALRYTSKRIRQEYQAAVRRETPLYVTIELTKFSQSDSVRIWRKLFQLLPTSFQRLYLQNDASSADYCTLSDPNVQRAILHNPRFSRLERYLESCSLLTELIIEWCLEECCTAHGSDWFDDMRRALVEAVKAHPNLRKYIIRTCYSDVYASRQKGQEWSDAGVFRMVVTDGKPPSEAWREFIRGMGGNVEGETWGKYYLG